MGSDAAARGTIATMKARTALGVVLLGAAIGQADDGSVRAWQQRLDVVIPLPVPVVELAAVNPFATRLDALPKLRVATAPEKLDLRVEAAAAVYVDDKGDCLGGVPLELPFPGIAAELVSELESNRFEAARSGTRPRPSWVVLALGFEGRVKKSAVLDQRLEVPDPDTPPVPAQPLRVAPPGTLAGLTVAPPAELTALATPKRINAKISGRDVDAPVRALVHITANGRCDAMVPLDVASGVADWLRAYAATWQLDPGLEAGEAVAAWMIYSARVRIELSSLKCELGRVLPEEVYPPVTE